ncbi:sigma-70 family RNA polymerase sigma factor [Anaerolineales bacterium]
MQENYNEQTDIDQLIQNCLKGNQQSYAAIYDLFASGAYRLCYSLLLNSEDAEDVMQESFVYAFKNIHRYDSSRASFKTWLYTIAVSRCRNVYRKRKFHLVDISQILPSNLATSPSEGPEAYTAYSHAIETIQQALVELSPRLREAIVLRYGQGLTYREIAEIMACPQKTAESRVRLGQEKLKQVLSPVGKSILEELLSY